MQLPNFSQVLADIREQRDEEQEVLRVEAAVAMEDALNRSAAKAASRRFDGAPITGFGGIGVVGSDRWLDVRDEEEACDREDQRREALGLGDEE